MMLSYSNCHNFCVDVFQLTSVILRSNYFLTMCKLNVDAMYENFKKDSHNIIMCACIVYSGSDLQWIKRGPSTLLLYALTLALKSKSSVAFLGTPYSGQERNWK